MTTIEKINLITEKVQRLLKEQQELIAANQALTTQLEQEKAQAQQRQQEQVALAGSLEQVQKELERRSVVEAELKTKVSALEAQLTQQGNTAGTMDEASKKAMEKQINFYIKEIDKCIALLSQ